MGALSAPNRAYRENGVPENKTKITGELYVPESRYSNNLSPNEPILTECQPCSPPPAASWQLARAIAAERKKLLKIGFVRFDRIEKCVSSTPGSRYSVGLRWRLPSPAGGGGRGSGREGGIDGRGRGMMGRHAAGACGSVGSGRAWRDRPRGPRGAVGSDGAMGLDP